MFFFKLMFLKNKKKTDDKGAALASVLLITTFVMVITSAVLSMAYNTYRMKLINVSSKDNLYACEAVLEQVRVGFRNQFAEITDAYSELTADDIEEAFETFYENYAIEDETIKVDNNYRVGNTDSGKGIYFYDVVKVAELLTSISGTDGASVVVHEDEAYKDLGYEDGTPIFTSWVEITVNDSDYDAITVTLEANATGKNNFELTETYVTFHDLTVIYSENGYESEVTTDITIEFPETGTETTITTSSGAAGGWVDVSDMFKSYTDWVELFDSGEATDFDRNSANTKSSDAYYINTTNYPANSVSYVIFDMARYKVYNDVGNYSHIAIYPKVLVQDGLGTGTQYAACEYGKYNNIEIYIGGDMQDDSSWVPYDEVFDSNNYVVTNGRDDPTSSVYKYIAYYGDTLTTSSDSKNASLAELNITYRVHLIDDSGNQNSRGWIYITNGNSISDILPVISNAYMYVEIGDVMSDPVYFFGTEGTNEGDQYGYVFFDLTETNYNVGDVLKITLYNVDPDAIVANIANGYGLVITMQTPSMFGIGGASLATLVQDTDYTISYETNGTTLEIDITMQWSTYPYLSIYYNFGYGTANPKVTLTTEWETGSGTTTTTTTTTSSDAAIYYEDWRKE